MRIQLPGVLVIAVVSVSLAGCLLKGKQQQTARNTPPPPQPVVSQAPPPPPRKLSTPQTDVELPPAQPVNLEALAPPPQPEEAPAPAPATPRPARAPRTQPRVETPAPQQPAAAPPPQPAEPDRAPIQELLTPADLDRYQRETAEYKKEANTRLQQIQHRRLNAAEHNRVNMISSFIRDCDRAAQRNDWRLAHDLAERAVALAKELTGGK